MKKMGLFDKAKKLTDHAVDTVKDIDKGVNDEAMRNLLHFYIKYI